MISAITILAYVAVATYLVEHKADVNLRRSHRLDTPHVAACADSPALAKMLIAHGARLDAADHDGLTALAIAAQNAKVKTVPDCWAAAPMSTPESRKPDTRP